MRPARAIARVVVTALQMGLTVRLHASASAITLTGVALPGRWTTLQTSGLSPLALQTVSVTLQSQTAPGSFANDANVSHRVLLAALRLETPTVETQEGATTWRARILDPTNGTIEDAQTETVSIDLARPTGAVAIQEDTEYVGGTSVTLTLTADGATRGTSGTAPMSRWSGEASVVLDTRAELCGRAAPGVSGGDRPHATTTTPRK